MSGLEPMPLSFGETAGEKLFHFSVELGHYEVWELSSTCMPAVVMSSLAQGCRKTTGCLIALLVSTLRR